LTNSRPEEHRSIEAVVDTIDEALSSTLGGKTARELLDMPTVSDRDAKID
jgi:transcriptional regulator CtsR